METTTFETIHLLKPIFQPLFVKSINGFYTATFDGTSSPKILRINKLDANLNNSWDSSGVALSAYSTCEM